MSFLTSLANSAKSMLQQAATTVSTVASAAAEAAPSAPAQTSAAAPPAQDKFTAAKQPQTSDQFSQMAKFGRQMMQGGSVWQNPAPQAATPAKQTPASKAASDLAVLQAREAYLKNLGQGVQNLGKQLGNIEKQIEVAGKMVQARQDYNQTTQKLREESQQRQRQIDQDLADNLSLVSRVTTYCSAAPVVGAGCALVGAAYAPVTQSVNERLNGKDPLNTAGTTSSLIGGAAEIGKLLLGETTLPGKIASVIGGASTWAGITFMKTQDLVGPPPQN